MPSFAVPAGVGYPSATNTYTPNHAASQSLIVGFSRNPGSFPVADYCQYVPAKQMNGLYYVWASRQAARILSNDDSEHDWADGAAIPPGLNNLEGWTQANFITKRKAYTFTMGALAVNQASFAILSAESAVCAQQAMTARTMLVQNALANASWGNNTIAVDGGLFTAGQNWKTGSVGYSSNQGPNIKISLQYGEKFVHQGTIGVVQPAQLTLVVNPVGAQGMAASTEIQDYLKQSQFAAAQLRGDVPNQNGKWGLPTRLYNHAVSIEDAVRITSPKGSATDTINYILADGTAYLIARQGELEGIEGSRSYSTVQVFFHQDELSVGSIYDSINERYLGRVVSNFVPVVVSVLSGFQYTKILG